MGRPSQEAQPRDHTAEGILHSGHLELFIDEYIFGYVHVYFQIYLHISPMILSRGWEGCPHFPDENQR